MVDPESLDAVGLAPGDLLAGKYRVERVLGTGGMGVVVAAHHLELDEKVAIKFLLPAASAKAVVLARFEREARAAVKIKSEHVARVLDVGRLETGAPYMVMEHLEGGDLRAWLRERGPMSAAQAAEFVLQACEAIAEAHALGIVHRDLKPANLFCVKRADGLLSIKVLDFGISKVFATATSSAELDVTSTGAIIGSPMYMSPEQLRASKDVDRRTDLWALGVILYELVSGRAPFRAGVLTELVLEIATEPPPSLRWLSPDLPAGFEDVVMRCLEKDREKRMQNVGELAIALRDFAPKRAIASVERILRTMEASGTSTPQLPPSGMFRVAFAETVSSDLAIHAGTASAWGQTGSGTKKKVGRAVILALAGAGVLLIAGGAVVAMARRGPAPVDALPAAASSGAPIGPPAPTQPAVDVPPSAPVASVDAPPSATAHVASPRPGGPRPRSSPAATRPATPPPPASPAAPSCHIVTEYDTEGQPHFKEVCK